MSLPLLIELESDITAAGQPGADDDLIKKLHASIIGAIASVIEVPPAHLTLETLLNTAASSSRNLARRLAMLLVRLLSESDSHPARQALRSHERTICELAETYLPDIVERMRLDLKGQTFEKIRRLEGVDAEVERLMAPLREVRPEAAAFAAERQRLMKALNDKLVSAYYQGYGFTELRQVGSQLIESMAEVANCTEFEFHDKLQRAKTAAVNLGDLTNGRSDPLGSKFAALLTSALSAISSTERSSAGKLVTDIIAKREGLDLAQKRYPLHEAGRVVEVSIPLVNTGPASAVDVEFEIATGSDAIAVNTFKYLVGRIRPGDFAISFPVLVTSPAAEIDFLVDLSWRTIASTERINRQFELKVQAQDPNIDWLHLEAQEPYSPDVAEGQEFVGREAKVTKLAGRFLRMPMQSTYITGQKRIGKTSLAKAAMNYATRVPGSGIIAVYLEWGDYARPTSAETVTSLGLAIVSLIKSQVPDLSEIREDSFGGSLVPLNRLASDMLIKHPNSTLLLILDEFDEIHPEMYRFGPLAEAFFANLRTLSAKKNVALMLVGGERMPFIIQSQGDQLNRFVQDRLDYYNRVEEWKDYVALVRQPSSPHLQWHDSAVVELFNLTCGHPYFTKLVCQRIFHEAVRQRDSEITPMEVERAAYVTVQQLDVNSFAHFWKDAIQAEPEQAAVVEINRCRTLGAVARCIRAGKPVTIDNIVAVKDPKLPSVEIPTLMLDFCRREILKERHGSYEIVLPLFQMWLIDNGYSKLIADRLGDELADAVRAAEDKAYVTPSELVLLTEQWPLYRGRRLTAENVRAWLDQVETNAEKRILFKLLRHLKFFSEDAVRERLRDAHAIVRREVSATTPTSRSDRLYDVIVTYLDREGKSGQYYASKYAEENYISTTCIASPENFVTTYAALEKNNRVKTVVVMDDIVATGSTMCANLEKFFAEHRWFISQRGLLVLIVVLAAVTEGEERVRRTLRKFPEIKADIRVCAHIDGESILFSDTSKLWATSEEAQRAKALVLGLGSKISLRTPLGYGNLGLLVVFPDTCPNNSLPILHSEGPAWRPLFPRPMN